MSRAAPARASSAAGVATPGTGASFVEFMMQFFPRKRTVLCVLADKSPELPTGEAGGLSVISVAVPRPCRSQTGCGAELLVQGGTRRAWCPTRAAFIGVGGT